MTDTSEDGNYLVRVRAQVMSRDDSSGGWVPLGGGGLSNVSVRKRVRVCPSGAPQQGPESSTQQQHDYLIHGKRISDESSVLRCTIKKDFEYNKVMPTFHHWKTEDKRFGLTFQTAADARAFDKGVRTAVEELLDGFADTYPQSALQKCQKDVGDDDVFMTLNLPQEPPNSRSSSDSSSKGSEHIRRIHYIGGERPEIRPELRPLTYDPLMMTGGGGGGEKGENYSYVQLTAVHEYIYPVVEDQKAPACRRDAPGSLKKPVEPAGGQPPKHDKQRIKIRCRYCQELYTPEHNSAGSCEFAPDRLQHAINTVTCLGCAQCISYHCASDAEGDYAQHPCGGDCADDNCAKRWLCLTLLSLFVPCLWCYPPLKLCHWCGVKCGLCGGKHNMMPN